MDGENPSGRRDACGNGCLQEQEHREEAEAGERKVIILQKHDP